MTCQGCKNGTAFESRFSMAFQPIIDTRRREVFAHEALVRGLDGSGAVSVLSLVDPDNRYAFDQQCRVRAIELAASLFPRDRMPHLSINFMPNAVYEPRACIRQTLETARRTDFPLDRIIFEFTEVEKLDTAHLLNILRSYREIGFKTAIDDFGAGYSGLNLLTRFQPDLVKLDMDLIRGIDTDSVKQIVVSRTLDMLRELGVTAVCEGVETAGELQMLTDLGVDLIQGYYIARPTFEGLSPVPAALAA
ncbi:MAG: EAL domain-containing protein [Alphaproteobacteria bacterium]|jgi:EAL domain-containing protein (putative c-di-GMP-specific phosphodiesterase class I)|nr:MULTISPECIES: EAL domain-containing protein [Rhizobium/Agrobacterium group]MBU0738160.1 EAL domain-containing protein [Alphaproteobacteria bacterium]MDM7980838.1 EAL domain-containing protein [Rhizobium sp.]AOG12333.1 EAL domain protein [Agrobacterium sp. RAC06]KPF61298.1 diguanylate phosphodiesterase [Rhizobium sp. AAP116]MBU0835103.1 EAL domain-containing protein [Alphaproteobacteria bacterium]